MPLFNSITAAQFVTQYWQQRALLLRESFADFVGVIDGDELAGLACEEDVESRLISGFELAGKWQCRQGPFDAKDFAALPHSNWTLLVQGVDQWDENIRAILDQFHFLPTWRLEDIMASYAVVGGGVGPHFDYYDVFLIQVSGVREWQLGPGCDERTRLQDNDQVKLLEQFQPQVTHKVVAGDALYIPAGMAHWGRALSADCITLSVGFRAPSEQEIVAEALEISIQQIPANARYRDAPRSIDKHPNKINAHVEEALDSVLEKLTPDQFKESVHQAFGQLVTEPRHPRTDEPAPCCTATQIRQLLARKKTVTLTHDPHSRFAFSDTRLFVNGEAFQSDEAFSRSICDKAVEGSLSDDQLSILVELLNKSCVAIRD